MSTPVALVSCLLLAVSTGRAASTPANGVTDFSLQFDMLVGLLKMGMAEEGSHDTRVPDFHASGLDAQGVTLRDTATFKRNGPIYMTEPQVDYMTVYGSVGFGNLQLNVSSLRMDGRTFPALVTVGSNSIDFSYTLEHKSKRGCVTRWSKLVVAPLGRVTVRSGQAPPTEQDMTDYFNREILPEMNTQMASQRFLARMGREFNFCISRFFPI